MAGYRLQYMLRTLLRTCGVRIRIPIRRLGIYWVVRQVTADAAEPVAVALSFTRPSRSPDSDLYKH